MQMGKTLLLIYSPLGSAPSSGLPSFVYAMNLLLLVQDKHILFSSL
jgi:hypothetical protein